MIVKDIILSIKSKQDVDKLVALIGNDKKRMKELMNCFFSKDKRLCQKTAWPMLHIALKNEKLIKPYYKNLVDNLNQPHHDAVIRNTVRLFQDVDIPSSLEGKLYDRCFHYLVDSNYPTAIKAFSISILEKTADKFPELKHELISAIEDQFDHCTIGFQNRASKIIKRLKT